MGIMNHMLNYEVFGIVFPNMGSAADTNSEESIRKQLNLCGEEHGRRPHVVLVSRIVDGEREKLTLLCSWTGSMLGKRLTCRSR